jgi:hypothetical protein
LLILGKRKASSRVDASRADGYVPERLTTLPPEGDIQKQPTGGREWLKYPKKIKREVFNELLDNKTLDNKSLDIYN